MRERSNGILPGLASTVTGLRQLLCASMAISVLSACSPGDDTPSEATSTLPTAQTDTASAIAVDVAPHVTLSQALGNLNSDASGQPTTPPLVGAAEPEPDSAPVSPGNLTNLPPGQVLQPDTDKDETGSTDTVTEQTNDSSESDAHASPDKTDTTADAGQEATDTQSIDTGSAIDGDGSDPTPDSNTDPDPSKDNAKDTDKDKDADKNTGTNSDNDSGNREPDTATDTGTEQNPDAGNATDQNGAGSAEPAVEAPKDGVTESPYTPGFTGELLDSGVLRVQWPEIAGSRGYNVYRNARYMTTVWTNRFDDETVFDGSHYYEIDAFDFNDQFSQAAEGLTVQVDGSGRQDPNPPATNEFIFDSHDLVFQDEFDGQTLDLTKWNTRYLWGPDIIINSELQYYVNIKEDPNFGYDPFEVSNGVLKIRTIPTPPGLLDKAQSQPYLSGVISSHDSLKFTYGYAETRANVPFGKGFWSAFWLLNAYYVEREPEIDIMEHIGHERDVAFHTYHYYGDGHVLHSTDSFPAMGVDYTQGFHTFGVLWMPNTLVFYIDGKETLRIDDPMVSDQEMYLLANVAVGGWWPGQPDSSTEFPGEYAIDYIRVWQPRTPYSDGPVLSDDSSTVPLSPPDRGSRNHRPDPSQWRGPTR